MVLYWERGARKYQTLGLHSKLSKSQAQEKQAEFMQEVNARHATSPDPDVYRMKWKRSTASTSESRIRHHLIGEYKDPNFKTLD